jgi:uncharacterized protein with HEPN domain
MKKSPTLALIHVYDAIEELEGLLGSLSAPELDADRQKRLATERVIEIVSEASRRLEPSWKMRFPEIPWGRIAGIGNVFRHDYEFVDSTVIVELRTEGHLDQLRRAVEVLLEEQVPDWRRLRDERRRRADEDNKR